MWNFVRLFIKNILKLIMLNWLFIIFGATVITIPASYAAMVKTLWQIIEDGEEVERLTTVASAFVKAFKNNFRQATICGWLVLLLCGGFLYAIWFFGAWHYAEESAFLQVMATIFVVVSISIGNSATIMIGAVALPIKVIIKNSFLLMPINVIRTIGGALLEVLIIVSCVLLIHHIFPIVLMIVFSFLGLTEVYLLKPLIQKYICLYEVKSYE